MVCDVNQLKRINDAYGHEKGDDFLVRNCQRLCQIYMHSPVYRIGGDEFLVYLTGQDYRGRDMLLSAAEAACAITPLTANAWECADFAVGMGLHEPGVQ